MGLSQVLHWKVLFVNVDAVVCTVYENKIDHICDFLLLITSTQMYVQYAVTAITASDPIKITHL